MGSFRRFVIGLAEVIQFLSIIVSTLICGAVGGGYGALFGGNYDIQIANPTATSSGAILGFCAGALIGFTTSATIAAFLFVLAEIAANTRNTNRLLRSQANLVEQGHVRELISQTQVRTEPRL